MCQWYPHFQMSVSQFTMKIARARKRYIYLNVSIAIMTSLGIPSTSTGHLGIDDRDPVDDLLKLSGTHAELGIVRIVDIRRQEHIINYTLVSR